MNRYNSVKSKNSLYKGLKLLILYLLDRLWFSLLSVCAFYVTYLTN